jgi:hypothetical protein
MSLLLDADLRACWSMHRMQEVRQETKASQTINYMPNREWIAKSGTPVSPVMQTAWAAIADPFGNI